MRFIAMCIIKVYPFIESRDTSSFSPNKPRSPKHLIAYRAWLALVAILFWQGYASNNCYGLEAPPATQDIVVHLGEKSPTFEFKDIRGVTRTLNDLGPNSAYVLMFTTTDCPIVKKTIPKLKEVYLRYRDKSVAFLCVNVGPNDTLKSMASQAISFDAPWAFVKDYDAKAAQALGVTHTPEFVILNSDFELCYRGRFDDQIRLGGAKPTPSRDDLVIALNEVLDKKQVTVPETPVDGCVITDTSTSQKQKSNSWTFYQHVAPILYQACTPCHRPGTAAPFSLISFTDANAHAEMIAEVVRDETMPPWYAAKSHGKFQNDRSLSAEEKQVLLQWCASDRLEGNQDLAPPLPTFEETPWRIGTPDLILTTVEQHTIPPTGFVPYKYVVLPHLFLSETWVEAFEIRPLNPAVVHHCNMAYATSKGASEETFITGYVPGGQPMDLSRFENGVAYKLPAGSALGLQIHYTTTGQEEKCRIQVGLRFPRNQVRKQLKHFVLDPRGWKIPPNNPAFRIEAKHTLEHDADLLGLFTHMHVRGRDMTFYASKNPASTDPTLIGSNDNPEILLQIPNYNFEWQLGYELTPGTKHLPKGTVIQAVAHFDNSKFNPYNPDPTTNVEYGPQTIHEMFNGFVFYVDQHETLEIDVDPKSGRPIRKKP